MVILLTDCKWITLFVIVVVMKKPMGEYGHYLCVYCSVRFIACQKRCRDAHAACYSLQMGERRHCARAPLFVIPSIGGGRLGNAHSHSIVEGGLEEMS